ncbi:MAG: glycosyltransferase family 4 protein [Alphaproteobacteria bacterium]|nr:glycosyltransferase family 4 protein [Alphaproteobacteria bacterium]
MSAPAIVYDITRLATRFSRPAPNGIDRVDLAYAQHFLGEGNAGFGAMLNPLGPRLVDSEAAGSLVSGIVGNWAEDADASHDRVLQKVASFLSQSNPACVSLRAPAQTATGRYSPLSSFARYARSNKVLGRGGLFPGRSLARNAPAGSVYINTSQFPLWVDWYFRWLDVRKDVRAVFFVHDLLPLTHPEFFPAAEEARHRQRLAVLARRASGVIVASEFTRRALLDHIISLGLKPPPVAVVPLPVDDAFFPRPHGSPTIRSDRPYFVSVGTIEPRKNQLLLLQVWRELALDMGEATPKLVLIGARGWDNENVVDLLDRCEALRPFVIEVAGLSTPAVAELISGSAAVLLPTLAEGFGLPAYEAQRLGARVIVSDIPVLRPLSGPGVLKLHPLDGPGWMAAIRAHSEGALLPLSAHSSGQCDTRPTWPLHQRHVSEFIRDL